MQSAACLARRFFGQGKRMDEKMIKAILLALEKGDRVELIPVKDGVKVMRVRREEMKKSPGEPGD